MNGHDNIFSKEIDYDFLRMLLVNDREFMENPTKKRAVMILNHEVLSSLSDAIDFVVENFSEIKEDCVPSKVIDTDVKTYKGWLGSEKDFYEYVNEGDKVDLEFVEYFRDVVPPTVNGRNMVQCGEPYSHAKEGLTYETFIFNRNDDKYGEIWIYKGHCLENSFNHGTPITRV